MTTRRAKPDDPERSGARARTLVSSDGDKEVQTVRVTDPQTLATLGGTDAVALAGEQAVTQPRPDERYEHRGEIARGGMSTVERVYDRLLCRTAAMKRLATDEPGAELRFVEE